MAGETPKQDTNIYRVRRDSKVAQGIFLCKIIMKKHGSVQIEGVGESISIVAKLAQILSKDGLAQVELLTADNIGENQTIKPKLIAKLKTGARFEELTQNIVPKWCLCTWKMLSCLLIEGYREGGGHPYVLEVLFECNCWDL